MLSSVLVANRGEIAVRVIRTLRRLGIRSIAVYSDADAGALHVRLADEAYRIGPAEAARSYLDIGAVLEASRRSGAEAIHPGYGFLSENAAFAEACAAAGIVFIGPEVEALRVMGDKIRARQQVEARGVPTVPGLARPGLTDEELIAAAPGIGFPVLIKPSAGGGGKGMHVVDSADELPSALATARREAAGAFGDDTLFLERFVRSPRHIEVQVLADTQGTTIHLGERECSLQRRHQKVVEEAPSPLLDAETRARIGEAACETARSVGYRGAGTVEFIVSADAPDEFFFMEMNTRLQVEHPVTELVTGVDLVEQQLRIAAGESLSLTQHDIRLTGHAVEARVYAEDPARGFLPTGGRIAALAEPSGEGVRVDSALVEGLEVTSDYDPMLAKVIAWAPDRDAAFARLASALGEFVTVGVTTNVPFLRRLVTDPAVLAGELDTGLIERRPELAAAAEPSGELFAAAALALQERRSVASGAWGSETGWRMSGRAPLRAHLVAGGREERVVVASGDAELRPGADAGHRILVVDGTTRALRVDPAGDGVALTLDGTTTVFRPVRTERSSDAAHGSPELRSSLPGTVVAVHVADGAHVEPGDPVLVVEAMKMEHVLRAEQAGAVRLRAAVGDRVAADAVVATIEQEDTE